MWVMFWQLYGIITGFLLSTYFVFCFFYYVFSELPEKRRKNCFQFYKTYRKKDDKTSDEDELS